MRRHHQAFEERVVEANAVRLAKTLDRAGMRPEVLVLRTQAHFDGMAGEHHILLRQRQGLALGDAQLPLDQVQPCHCFGHGMFDLQPRVHLHQIELRNPSMRNSTVPAPT